MASRGTVYDLDINASKKLAVTVGQDKKLNFLSLSNGKSVKSFKPEGDSGEPIKVKVDPSGTCLVCSYSDKSLRLYDISNGDLLSLGQGHSEVITGVIFIPDCKRLISVSGDGCIFVWKLPSSISKMMRKGCNCRSDSQASHASMQPPEMKAKQVARPCADDTDPIPLEAVPLSSRVESGIPSAFKFSVSRLPHWAQAMVSQTTLEKEENNVETCSLYSSDSRWAERLGAEGYKLFCEPEVLTPPATVLPNNFGNRRRFTIEPSASSAYSTPESSLGSELSVTSSTSPIVSGRKHTYWKTVHTLLFDEEDVCSERHLLLPPSLDNELQNADHPNASKVGQGGPVNLIKDDSSVVYLSEDEQQPAMSMISMLSKSKCDFALNSEHEPSTSHVQKPTPLACLVNHQSRSTESVLVRSKLLPTPNCRFEFTKDIQQFPGSPGENVPQRQGHEDKRVMPATDDTSDEDENDLPFCPDSNLFNSYFGNLSTAIKVQAGKASARSSFSTRFFAQLSHPLPVLSLFQDSPQSECTEEDKRFLSNERCAPLAEERENLKLKELQDNIVTGAVTTRNNSGVDTLCLIDHDIEELQGLDERQPVFSSVNEQSSSVLDGALSVDGTVDCVDLANDPSAQSCILPLGMDDKLCAVLTKSNVQSLKKEINAIDVESNPGTEKCGSVIEGKAFDVCLIEEHKDRCLDITNDGPGCTNADSHKPEESLTDLKNALQDLTSALDKAIGSFRELNSNNERGTAILSDISDLYEEYILQALQKVWLLSDSMTAVLQRPQETASACDNPPIFDGSHSSYSDHGSLRLSNTGMSRPCTAASAAATSSAIESIDIEGFIENYSVRFSTTLANQVLALVKKGLSGHLEK